MANDQRQCMLCLEQVQLTTLCVSVTLSASVALVCLFGPKLHIIAFETHKNVRKLTMTTSQAAMDVTSRLQGKAVNEMGEPVRAPDGVKGRARLNSSRDSQRSFGGSVRSGCVTVLSFTPSIVNK